MRPGWSRFCDLHYQHENGDLIMITDRGEFIIVPKEGSVSAPFRTPEVAMDAYAAKADLVEAALEGRT